MVWGLWFGVEHLRRAVPQGDNLVGVRLDWDAERTSQAEIRHLIGFRVEGLGFRV